MQFDISEESQARVETYSQEGEDILIRRFLKSSEPGFYVDVGAHHPLRFSNTYFLYKAGWSGINIDPNPGSKELFDQHRPRDINLDYVVSEEDGSLVQFDVYSEPAFNSAVRERRDSLSQFYSHTLEKQTVRLDTLLRKHLPAGSSVQLLSVDVEGLDLSVLRSNDWSSTRPSFVLAETLIDLRETNASELVSYMNSVGYRLRAYLYLTALFVPNEASQF